MKKVSDKELLNQSSEFARKKKLREKEKKDNLSLSGEKEAHLRY